MEGSPKYEEVKNEHPINTLKSEHLNSGVRPIIACIGTPEQFQAESGKERDVFSRPEFSEDYSTRTNTNVNYFGNPDFLREQNFKTAGKESYFISPIDSSNKFSKSFRNCTGLVATGIDRKTGENISFLTHQDPKYFLRGAQTPDQGFIDDLRKQLQELKDRCLSGTIDAVIMGGDYFPESIHAFRQEEYIRSIEVVAKETQDLLGFEPVVMMGPKKGVGSIDHKDDVFYDNNTRRLYIMREDAGKESLQSYLPSTIHEERKKW